MRRIATTALGVLLVASLGTSAWLLSDRSDQAGELAALTGALAERDQDVAHLEEEVAASAEQSRRLERATEQLSTLESQVEELESQLADRDQRIGELEGQATASASASAASPPPEPEPEPATQGAGSSADVPVFEGSEIVDWITADEVEAFQSQDSASCEANDPVDPSSGIQCWYWPDE